MKRSNLNEGTREEILAELGAFHRDRHAQGSTDKAEIYKAAAELIASGADEVRVFRSIYRVVEN